MTTHNGTTMTKLSGAQHLSVRTLRSKVFGKVFGVVIDNDPNTLAPSSVSPESVG